MILRLSKIFPFKLAFKKRRSNSIFSFIYKYIKLTINVSIIVYFCLFYFKKLPKILDPGFDKYFTQLIKILKLTLENVYLEGQNYTDLDQIMNKLDLKVGQNILSFSVSNIQKQLLEINWIKYAIVERNLPNTLFIGIIEKNPIALWQHNNQFNLIDEDGEVITNANIERFSNYIIIIGQDAPKYIQSLLCIISKDQKLFKNISHAIRIGDRRWDIKFHNNIVVKLPEENFESAWNYIVDLHNKQNLFGKNISTIDLRIASKMYIK